MNRNYLNTGLVLPRSSDGAANESTADVIRREINEANPIDSATRDAVFYIVEGLSGDELRKAINIRNGFLSWKVVDSLIEQARPLAEKEIAKQKAERTRAAQEQIAFEQLAGLFAEPVRLEKTATEYTLSGLTEKQVRVAAMALANGI